MSMVRVVLVVLILPLVVRRGITKLNKNISSFFFTIKYSRPTVFIYLLGTTHFNFNNCIVFTCL